MNPHQKFFKLSLSCPLFSYRLSFGSSMLVSNSFYFLAALWDIWKLSFFFLYISRGCKVSVTNFKCRKKAKQVHLGAKWKFAVIRGVEDADCQCFLCLILIIGRVFNTLHGSTVQPFLLPFCPPTTLIPQGPPTHPSSVHMLEELVICYPCSLTLPSFC